jgi:pSer/pThr/pTyr-binding forkhead associated (FHA) protein
MPKLILKFQGALIKEYDLDQPSIKIGRREGNDIQIDNLAVSGNHAEIQKVDGSHIIVDLKSTNGTFVNRKKVVQAKLNHLDEITIGKHTLIYEEEKQELRKSTEPDKTAVREKHVTQDASEVKKLPLELGDASPQMARKEAKPKPSTGKVGRFRFLGTGGQPDIVLEKKLSIIGRRDDADIRLKGPFAPKVAAYVNRKPTGYSIIPEEKVRVKVNGELVSRQTELSNGDIIDVGSLKLEFKES